jgi:molybdenum cofactor cytidylyltransferase
VSTAAVILAAGRSSRFADPAGGEPGSKLLATLRGRPVIAWALEPALEAGLDEVIVVSGACELGAALPAGVSVVVNERWASGLASSLRAGLDRCRARGHSGAVVSVGDAPGLSADAWRRVRDAPRGPVVFATYDGRRGHPVRLDAEVWDLMPASGDEGARALARAHPELVHEVACPGESGDVDTRDDLQRWETRWS